MPAILVLASPLAALLLPRPCMIHAQRCACIQLMAKKPTDDSLAMPYNRYVDAILNISAPELIKGFAETAPAEVQQAVRATLISLLGNLPPNVFDVSIASTGQNLASLMYSMQMTGCIHLHCELTSLPPAHVPVTACI